MEPRVTLISRSIARLRGLPKYLAEVLPSLANSHLLILLLVPYKAHVPSMNSVSEAYLVLPPPCGNQTFLSLSSVMVEQIQIHSWLKKKKKNASKVPGSMSSGHCGFPQTFQEHAGGLMVDCGMCFGMDLGVSPVSSLFS